MKISHNWLTAIANFDLTPEEVAATLTQTGLEVSATTPFSFIPEQLVLGEITAVEPHPNADKLTLTTINIEKADPLHIICGAPNLTIGDKVVVAPIGTTLTPNEGEPFKIKKAKIRGIASDGMLCSAQEIGIGTTHDTILTLDTAYLPGTPLTKVWDTPPDTIYHIDLTPNRNDAISHAGVLRDLLATQGRVKEAPIVTPIVPSDNLPLHIVNRAEKAAPYYSAIVLTDITVKDSPIWLQNRLRSIGVRPINNVVDITNYIMHRAGQPLHAFDYDAIARKKITLQYAEEGTPFTSLTGKTYQLNAQDLIIADGQGPLSLAGIIGGQRSSITSKTKTILLESAYFDPAIIYQTAKRHQLSTDSGYRFERGTNPYATACALQKAVQLLEKNADGRVASQYKILYPNKIGPHIIPITYSYIYDVIGFQIPPKTILKILQALAIIIHDETKEGFTAHVSPMRRDVTRPIDLVEEILRIYGYNKKAISEDMRRASSIRPSDRTPRKCESTIKKLLATNGFCEVVTPPLVADNHVHLPNKAVNLANPPTESHPTLRQSLLAGGIEAVVHNLNRGENPIKLFEIDHVYHRTAKGYEEKKKVGIWLAGAKNKPHWTQPKGGIPLRFRDLQAVVGQVFFYATGATCHFHPTEHPHYSFTLELRQGATTYGHIGIVAPSMLKAFEVENIPLYYAELEADLLTKKGGLPTYQPLSKYPPITRDISFITSNTLPYSAVEAAIGTAIGKEKITELQRTTLIDYYTNPSLGKEKASFTIRFSFRSDEKTLSDKFVNKLVGSISQQLVKEIQAKVRE